MNFRTIVPIDTPDFQIEPMQQLLFVGSCFAENIGRRFQEERFPVVINPYGVMYNPVSVLHTVRQCTTPPQVAFITLGTNHVYRLRETGQIVDNCQKRPQRLFQEEQLSVAQCVDALSDCVLALQQLNPSVRVIVSVSPIRYAKYGYHGSQLSKAVLLLAAHELGNSCPCVYYFPAYEIVLDELRDYRFYQPDMLHPSAQAVEYIWERFVDCCFSPRAKQYLQEWKPIKEALAHRPFNPDSPEYQQFLMRTHQQERDFLARYLSLAV